MSRVRTTKQRSSREKASDRRRLYEVPERALIEPQGTKGAWFVREGDTSEMQDGRIVRRRPKLWFLNRFEHGLGEWIYRYGVAGTMSRSGGTGDMTITRTHDNLDFGMFQVWTKLQLQKDIEVAARMKVVSGDALLGARLGGDVYDNGDGTYTDTQSGIWIAVGSSAAKVYKVVNGTETVWGNLATNPGLNQWFWATLTLKGSWVWASIGIATEADFKGEEPLADAGEVTGAGHLGVGVLGDDASEVVVDEFIARTPTV